MLVQFLIMHKNSDYVVADKLESKIVDHVDDAELATRFDGSEIVYFIAARATNALQLCGREALGFGYKIVAASQVLG